MDGTAKPPSPFPEVAAFRRHYNDLLTSWYPWDPVKLAGLLFSDGVISREVQENVAASADVEQRRVILDGFLHALHESSQPGATMRSLRRAFGKAHFYTEDIDNIEGFVDGEYIYIR